MRRRIVLCIALLTTMIGFGQDRQKDPQKMAAHQTQKMKTMLLLDDAQYAAVKKINDEYAVRFMTFRNEEKPLGNDKREALKKLREDKQNEIAAVLTPEQRTTWKAFRDERRANKKARMEGRYIKKKEELKTALSLSDEQVINLERHRESFMKNKIAIKNDSGLSDADRKRKMDALKSEHDSAMKKILTPEQYEKLKRIQTDRKDHNHKKQR